MMPEGIFRSPSGVKLADKVLASGRNARWVRQKRNIFNKNSGGMGIGSLTTAIRATLSTPHASIFSKRTCSGNNLRSK